ncbi:MAG TPA: hypothetical protein VIV12_28010, partial [Streptosporangiaceae bacterium]
MPLRFLVDGPAWTQRPYGLFSVVQDRGDPNPHWRQGISYEVICATGATTYDPCVTVTGSSEQGGGIAAAPAKTVQGITFRGATAFRLFLATQCAMPAYDGQDIDTRLMRAEQFAVEQAFWTGAAGGQTTVFPHLAANTALSTSGLPPVLLQSAAVSVTGAPLDVVEGIGRLEDAIGNVYDGIPVLHVPEELGPAMANANLLIRVGDHLETPSGSLVALGSGYTGSAPDGTTSTLFKYVYATGALIMYRGSDP